jgi:hypothetical protein
MLHFVSFRQLNMRIDLLFFNKLAQYFLPFELCGIVKLKSVQCQHYMVSQSYFKIVTATIFVAMC